MVFVFSLYWKRARAAATAATAMVRLGTTDEAEEKSYLTLPAPVDAAVHAPGLTPVSVQVPSEDDVQPAQRVRVEPALYSMPLMQTPDEK